MDDDEDEAEIPMRAMRRPVVMAIAVQSEWCCTSPAGGQQLGIDGGGQLSMNRIAIAGQSECCASQAGQ